MLSTIKYFYFIVPRKAGRGCNLIMEWLYCIFLVDIFDIELYNVRMHDIATEIKARLKPFDLGYLHQFKNIIQLKIWTEPMVVHIHRFKWLNCLNYAVIRLVRCTVLKKSPQLETIYEDKLSSGHISDNHQSEDTRNSGGLSTQQTRDMDSMLDQCWASVASVYTQQTHDNKPMLF